MASSSQEADLAIAPLTLTAARERVVGMTKPFMQTGISILLRKDISEGASFFDFLTPFAPETWIGILIAYVGTAACIFIVARLFMRAVSFLRRSWLWFIHGRSTPLSSESLSVDICTFSSWLWNSFNQNRIINNSDFFFFVQMQTQSEWVESASEWAEWMQFPPQPVVCSWSSDSAR